MYKRNKIIKLDLRTGESLNGGRGNDLPGHDYKLIADKNITFPGKAALYRREEEKEHPAIVISKRYFLRRYSLTTAACVAAVLLCMWLILPNPEMENIPASLAQEHAVIKADKQIEKITEESMPPVYQEHIAKKPANKGTLKEVAKKAPVVTPDLHYSGEIVQVEKEKLIVKNGTSKESDPAKNNVSIFEDAKINSEAAEIKAPLHVLNEKKGLFALIEKVSNSVSLKRVEVNQDDYLSLSVQTEKISFTHSFKTNF
ncbi:MAG: hypothetical protein M3Q97_06835 [Bacteroidota bacterium]|nr:hypothetical protein [Bacteroidota bacterium]